MFGLFGESVSLALGAVFGVIATSLMQERVDVALSSLRTGALISGQDLRGDWDLEYQVTGGNDEHVERSSIRLRQVGTRVRGECKPTIPSGFCYAVKGTVSHGTLIGSWTDLDRRSRMAGAFHCYIDESGEAVNGYWIGPNPGGGVRTGGLSLMMTATPRTVANKVRVTDH